MAPNCIIFGKHLMKLSVLLHIHMYQWTHFGSSHMGRGAFRTSGCAPYLYVRERGVQMNGNSIIFLICSHLHKQNVAPITVCLQSQWCGKQHMQQAQQHLVTGGVWQSMILLSSPLSVSFKSRSVIMEWCSQLAICRGTLLLSFGRNTCYVHLVLVNSKKNSWLFV